VYIQGYRDAMRDIAKMISFDSPNKDLVVSVQKFLKENLKVMES
jgi:hypothetical protein